MPNQNNDQSPTIVPPGSYHPVAIPPGATPHIAPNQPHQNPTGTTANRYSFQQCIDTGNETKTSTVLNTPHINNMSPASSANMTEALTQILTQVVNGKKDDLNKKMAKNIKTFDGTNKAECITWLSQAESAAKIAGISLREMVCGAVSPAILQVLAKLPITASDQDIRNIILANYSDVSNTTEATTKLKKCRCYTTNH